jgi:hypothetical protein
VSAEILTGRTTRPVTFTDKAPGSDGVVRLPAGTLVYVDAVYEDADLPSGGGYRIRIPGTLLDQVVILGSVEPLDRRTP